MHTISFAAVVLLLVVACDESSTEPRPDLVVFVDNPGSMQAGLETLIRVVVADPATDDLTDVVVGTCLRPPSGAPCVPESFTAIGSDPHVGQGTVLVGTHADPGAVGLQAREWQLIACARASDAELRCSLPVTVQVRPNPSFLCGTSPIPADSIVPIDPTLLCTIDGEEVPVAYVWLDYGFGYGLFFFDAGGEHVPAGGFIEEVFSFDGFDQQRTTIAGMGEGFAPPSTGGYYVVIGGLDSDTEGFAAVGL